MTDAQAPADEAAHAPDAAAPRWDTIVVGAGVGGLVVAHDLAARGYRVLVLEARDRVGGVASRLDLGGLELDGGAESFAVHGRAVAELVGELGLDAVEPSPGGAWLQVEGRAVPLPKASLLGIPSSPLAQDVIDAIGWGGALRAYADRLMPFLRIGQDDALGPLVRRRMGRRVLERLVAPLAGGVYSADPERLDIDVVAPGLNNAVTRAGSLSGGVAVLLEERGSHGRPGSAVQGVAGGIHRIPEALAARAVEHRAEVRARVRVASAQQIETGWAVTTDAGERLDASSLVVALPEPEAVRVLAGVEGFDALQDASAVAVELVTLVLPVGAVEGDPRGTGALVAQGTPGIRAKALTHATAKWPWLRSAAGGHEVVRLSYGADAAAGSGEPATVALDDAAATELALADASAIMGVALPAPVASARVRWQTGQPSSLLGAKARREALRAAAASHPGLVLVGAAVAGTGLAQVVPDARKAALEIRREDFAVPGRPWTDELEEELSAAELDTGSADTDTAPTDDARGDA